jgi:hypothetical protein
MTNTQRFSRRQFNATTLAAAAGILRASPAVGTERPPVQAEDLIDSIEPLGMYFPECTLLGEKRRDDVVPCHGAGIQVSRNRWLYIYSTHGFRGVDDERSIVYQLRADAPDGKVLKEGFLAQAYADAEVDGKTSPADGKTYFRQTGHPVVFGVPAGALIKGRPAANANVFAAKWRTVVRVLDKRQDNLEHGTAYPELHDRTQGVEWIQFRLNPQQDDIEILQPATALRQTGFESGPAFTSAKVVLWMNQSFVKPVPFTGDHLEWADCNSFDRGRVAALKYRFNPRTGLYEWVETGPLLSHAKRSLFEASLSQVGDAWAISTRINGGRGAAWILTTDPFASMPEPSFPEQPVSTGPLTSFTCADGVLRLFTGDGTVSPQRNARDPLYCWNIDPNSAFAPSQRRVVFDSIQQKIPIRPKAYPKVDFCELLPALGRTQLLTHRVVTRSYNHPYVGGGGTPVDVPPVTAEEKACSGIYYERITYRRELSAAYQFEGVAK